VSVDLFVFLQQDALPTVQQWQNQLDSIALDLVLDRSITVADHSGYLPATLEGSQSGFEFYTGAVPDLFEAELPAEASKCDLVANFVTHSDLVELKSAMIAAVALASAANGFIFDEATQGIASVSQLLAEAATIES